MSDPLVRARGGDVETGGTEHAEQVALGEDQQVIQALPARLTLPRKRSTLALARGARYGVRTLSTYVVAATGANGAPTLASWSRLKKRGVVP